MSARDILAIVTSTSGGEAALALGAELARQNSGRLSAALVIWQPNVAPVDGFTIAPIYAELVEDARKFLSEETSRLEKRLAQGESAAAVEPHFIEFGAAGSALGLRARHADLAVVVRERKADRSSARALVEAALFDSGRPVIVVPPEWQGKSVGKNVLIAWKPTREAARAVADADDFILNASRVSVVTVDASPDRGYSEAPGADIAAHLAFRGAKVELFNLASGGRSETQTILDQAIAVGADLIVMGGYGRSRISEFIFGGVTREILKIADRPVLMSH